MRLFHSCGTPGGAGGAASLLSLPEISLAVRCIHLISASMFTLPPLLCVSCLHRPFLVRIHIKASTDYSDDTK